MNLSITNTDNAAFDGDNRGVELARILREIAEKNRERRYIRHVLGY